MDYTRLIPAFIYVAVKPTDAITETLTSPVWIPCKSRVDSSGPWQTEVRVT